MEVGEKLLKLVFDSLLNQARDRNFDARVNLIRTLFLESPTRNFPFSTKKPFLTLNSRIRNSKMLFFIQLNSQAVGWESWVPLRLKSILWGTLFLNHLHDFSLLSWNSFLHPFLISKFIKKILDTKKIPFSKADFHNRHGNWRKKRKIFLKNFDLIKLLDFSEAGYLSVILSVFLRTLL